MPKPKVSDEYQDTGGKMCPRASAADFHTVQSRIFARTLEQLGSERADRFVLPGVNAYNAGCYGEALSIFEEATKLFPIVQDELAPYMEFCRNVLATPHDERDREHDELVAQWWRKPRLLRWILARTGSRAVASDQLRCKWCGHYTPYVDPNTGWAYFNGNNCTRCDRGYPMPDFGWDSLDGQAYIYYRGSVTERVFYQGFERNYDVNPVVRVRTGKWTKTARGRRRRK